MPAVSKSQQRLFGLAEHNPSALFKKNAKVANLSHEVLHEFAATKTKKLPVHVKKAPPVPHGVPEGLSQPNPAGHGVSELPKRRQPHTGHTNIVNPHSHQAKLLHG
jgi:hypothetical protein